MIADAYSAAAARPQRIPIVSSAPMPFPSIIPDTKNMAMIAVTAQQSFLVVSFSLKTSGESKMTIVGCI